MDFTATLVDKLKERGLTDSSVSLYVRNLEKLNANKPLNNLNFLKKYADIMGKLEGYKGNTQRGFLISIVSSLSSFKGDKGVDMLLKRYYKTMAGPTAETFAGIVYPSSRQVMHMEDWISIKSGLCHYLICY